MGIDLLMIALISIGVGWIGGMVTGLITQDTLSKYLSHKHEKEMFILRHKTQTELHLLSQYEDEQ